MCARRENRASRVLNLMTRAGDYGLVHICVGRCVRSQLACWSERRDKRYRRSFASSPWPIDREHRRSFDGGRIGSATGSAGETIRRASTPIASGFFPWARIGQVGPDQSVPNIGVNTPIYGILILGTFFDTRRT